MNLYTSSLNDHYHNPRNRGILDTPDFEVKHHNAACGDMVSWQVKVHQRQLIECRFQGHGCMISQATASLLSLYVDNRLLPDILQLNEYDMRQLIALDLGPLRIACALLPLQALQKGIISYVQTTSAC